MILGAMKGFVKHVVWVLLSSNLWSRAGTLEERAVVSILGMKTELSAFYIRHQRANPTERLIRLSNLTVKMVGRLAERKLATKAAEVPRRPCEEIARTLASTGGDNTLGTKVAMASCMSRRLAA